VIAASNLLEKLDPALCARAASTARSSSPRRRRRPRGDPQGALALQAMAPSCDLAILARQTSA
jgi:hypothetical protein